MLAKVSLMGRAFDSEMPQAAPAIASAGRRQPSYFLRNFVSLIETGQNQPTIGTISKLARALGMKASELVAAAEAEAVSTQRRARKPS